jgi:hypothetical protein
MERFVAPGGKLWVASARSHLYVEEKGRRGIRAARSGFSKSVNYCLS